MTRISQGELVSMRSRDRVLDIMRGTVNRSQLPQGLGKGATIAHKTGDIGGLIGDVGLIDMPNGKRYSLTVLVKRSFNDDSAMTWWQIRHALFISTSTVFRQPNPVRLSVLQRHQSKHRLELKPVCLLILIVPLAFPANTAMTQFP
jgi:hypothetical protein